MQNQSVISISEIDIIHLYCALKQTVIGSIRRLVIMLPGPDTGMFIGRDQLPALIYPGIRQSHISLVGLRLLV